MLYVAADTAGIARTDPGAGSPSLTIFATSRDLPAFLAYSLAAVTNVALALNGEPAATIVKGADAPEAESYAAQELQKYLQKISGATLPIKTTTDAVQGVQILVGTLVSHRLIYNLKGRLGAISLLGSDSLILKTVGNYFVVCSFRRKMAVPISDL